MPDDLTQLEQLVLQSAFALRTQHDATSLSNWLNGNGSARARTRQSLAVAKGVLQDLQKKGLLTTGWMGWFELSCRDEHTVATDLELR